MVEKRFWERLRRNPGYIKAVNQFQNQFPDYPQGEWSENLQSELDKFVTKWGFPPVPPSIESIDNDYPYYFPGCKRGLFTINIYPWTTKEEILDRFKEIREHFPQKPLHKEKSDTAKMIIQLHSANKDIREIALAVYTDSLPPGDRDKLEADLLFEKILSINLKKGMDEDLALKSAMESLADSNRYRELLNKGYQVGLVLSSLENCVRQFLKEYLP